MTTNFLSLPFAGWSDPFAEGRNALQAGLRFQAHALSGMLRYQIEALTFLRRRYERDVKLIEDFASSTEINDTCDAITEFARKATAEYSIEAGRILLLNAKLVSATAREFRKEAKDTVDDMTARTLA